MKDLTVLAPPLLVGAVFLIAVGAFLKREMWRGKNASDNTAPDESAPVSTDRHLSGNSQNPARSVGEAESGRLRSDGEKDDADTKLDN